MIVKPVDFEKLKEKVAAVASRIRSATKKSGPVLSDGKKSAPPQENKPTLSAEIDNRGGISIVILKGQLTNNNKAVINNCLKNLESVGSTTVIIDINAIETMDEFGCGTLAIMSGWLTMHDKEAFLSCDDGAMKEKVVALGIHHLVPEHPDPGLT